MLAADFKMSIGMVSIVHVYAPTVDVSVMDKETFYLDLQRTVDQVKEKGRSVFLSEDFNARTVNSVESGYGVLDLHGRENVKNK